MGRGGGTQDGAAASVEDTMQEIQHALRNAGAEYSCTTVSWDDVSRGEVNGSLSCWGANITDSYLKAKDGRSLFTVRSCNWNEKLGVVCASDVALLVGNGDGKGGGNGGGNGGGVGLRNVTLEQFLKNPTEVGARYAGMKEGVSLSDEALDSKVSIRFQTVFLPVEEDEDGRGRIQFAGEAYNYQTRSDEDPRNLVLLATTQGLSVQCDGQGAKRLLLHQGAKGDAREYWLEAESSKHKVGGEQKESKEEREDAIKRGKATSEVIGIKAMGTRFNVLMTIQVPLVQTSEAENRKSAFAGRGGRGGKRGKPRGGAFGGGGMFGLLGGISFGSKAGNSSISACAAPAPAFGMVTMACPPPPCAAVPPAPQGDGCMMEGLDCEDDEEEDEEEELFDESEVMCCEIMQDDGVYGDETTAPGKKKKEASRMSRMPKPRPAVKVGRASAARVSRGDYYGMHRGLPVTKPTRNAHEHVTVTCVLYNTVIGGVPNEVDVLAAVEDMDRLYAACTETGRLADAAFDFMKTELTVGNMHDIASKVLTQAPVAETPPATAPEPPFKTATETRDVVLAKADELDAAMTAEKALELKLIVNGALDTGDVRELVTAKIDAVREKISAGDAAGAKALVVELKLILKGSFS
mmetsp:Transcript_14103/g.30369  ORF Transcript_14103/g.30369 Transcript_14103/m.30369 type:complete len:635 (-) Transcript_14103:376-2280(-)